MSGWIEFDKQRPAEVGVEVWAWVVGIGPHPSILDPGEIVDIPVTPKAKVCKTYRSSRDGIRINCAGCERVTHWMPYHVPTAPDVEEKPE